MKIRELFYEYVLFIANVIGCSAKRGFFDKKYLYEKKGWLNWKVTKIEEIKK